MRHAVVVLVMSMGLVLAACGGGGSSGEGGLNLSVYQPDFLFSNTEGDIRLLGTGFGVRRTPVKVRFTAEAGTPFDGGTSATLEVDALTDSDRQIRGVAPATFVDADVDAFVTVILPDGTETTSDEPVAGFTAQSVLAVEVNGVLNPMVPSGSTPQYKLSGTGFVPLGGLAEVTFTAETGTPFFGGGSATMTTTGLIDNNLTITGLLNDGKVVEEAPAFVSVTLSDGTKIDSRSPLITFTPIPTIISFTPNFVAGGTTPAFTVNGTAFEGTSVAMTLVAAGGTTPFLGGTAAEVLVLGGSIDSPQQVSGVLFDIDPSEAGTAFVRLDFGGTGASAISDLPIVGFGPAPVITSFAPSTILSGNPSPCATAAADTSFTITGTDLGAAGTNVNVTFTATGGATPFANGTSATFTTTAQVSSPTAIGGSFPDPVADADAGVTVKVDYTSGASADSAPTKLSDVVMEDPFTAPIYSLAIAGSALAGGAQSDDSFTEVMYPAGFTPQFFSASPTSVFVNSNGCLTFDAGDGDFSPSLAEMTAQEPRIAHWWDDLSPNGSLSGDVLGNTTGFTDKILFTYDNIREYDGSTTAEEPINAQIVLHANGRIDIIYTVVDAASGFVGITPGGGAVASVVDFSSVVFGSSCATASPSNTTVETATTPFDLANKWIVFYPNGSGGYEYTTGN